MRDRIIRIRISEVESSTIKDLAKSRGLSLSDMVRRAALGVRMPARSLNGADAVLIARLLGELGQIGGNLNQMVRRANSGKLSGYDAELSYTLAGIDALRGRLREIVR
ncbi:plasmid mobilization protein [Sinorhizobium meliloti]|uniref:plasmid mobilization protein n=1 Tax=Rhizobium meliloti TaxID=382 RepID=UPI0003F57447|nr:plasmid mobilization relaxosome protein MobC [Sinorhizobium meliloti]